MIDFFAQSRESLRAWLISQGESRYRADQLFNQVYRHGRTDISEMTDLSKVSRSFLAERLSFTKGEIVDTQESLIDGTIKYLIKFQNRDGSNKSNVDGQTSAIEAVLINQVVAKREDDDSYTTVGNGNQRGSEARLTLHEARELKQIRQRKTLCVSSQVGCGMGCKFCRTGEMGFYRNLSTAEIVGQIEAVIGAHGSRDLPFDNIVFMGMGEPLHNYDNVSRALAILTDPKGYNISPRKITVSTVGLVPKIKRFIEETQVSLAVSLNATTDAVRSEIMPVNRKWPIRELLDSLAPLRGTKRIVTIEYVMLAGVNDHLEDLTRLNRMLRSLPVRINLIPFNKNAGLPFSPPNSTKIKMWQKELRRLGYTVTVRWSKGIDIDAACGQLAYSEKQAKAS